MKPRLPPVQLPPCPECGEALRPARDSVFDYRCANGHAFYKRNLPQVLKQEAEA